MYKDISVIALLICLLGSSVYGKSMASFIYMQFHNWQQFSRKESVYELSIHYMCLYVCINVIILYVYVCMCVCR